MSVSRRQFLATSAATAVVASSTQVPRIWADASLRAAAVDQGQILVVVQLSGGNDGLNTIIPHGDDVYHANRFTTRIQSRDVLKIDDYLGWNPAMTELAELHNDGRLTIVQGVGYPNPNRSHFESMDIWHSAQMEPPHRTGWLGRWVDACHIEAVGQIAGSTGVATENLIPALHVGDEPLPLALAGLNVMVPSLKAIDSLRVMPDDVVAAALKAQGIDRPANRHELLEFLTTARNSALDASQRLEKVGDYPQQSGYDGSALARKLACVAQLISIDFGPRVYYVELAGFDTHSQQLEAHRALLSEVSRSVAAFHRDLRSKQLDDSVLTVCFSEFGRRVKENGSRGTDHGTAAPMLICGPEKLPRLAGKYPSLTDLDSGDLKFTVDFRSVYATLLENWLGVSSEPVLGKRFQPLPLFG